MRNFIRVIIVLIICTSKSMAQSHDEFMSYIDSGHKYSARDNYIKSIECFTKAIAIEPNNIVGYTSRGFDRRHLGDYQGAIADFTMCIKIYPHSDAYDNRGDAKALFKDYEGAFSDFQIAIKLNPNDDVAYRLIAKYKAECGKYKEAIEALNKVNELDDRLNIYLFRGKLYYIVGEYEKSILDLNKFMEYEPNEGIGYYYRGLVKLKMNQCQSACIDLKKADSLEYTAAADTIKFRCIK